MATVTITGAQRRAGSDAVTVVGTVDGTPQQVVVNASHLATLATKAQKVAYVAQLLKNVNDAATVVVVDLNATVQVP